MNPEWRRRAFPLLLATGASLALVVFWLVAASPPTAVAPAAPVVPSVTPSATPASTLTPTPASEDAAPLTPVWEVARPPRDLAALAARFSSDATPGATSTPASRTHQVGEEQSLWVTNVAQVSYVMVKARLAAISEHAYFLVEDGVEAPEASLQQAVADFEKTVYPSVGEYFGPLEAPGPDGDRRVTILICHLSGPGGYHSGADFYPPSVQPYSNYRKIIYVNADASTPVGSPRFAALLAHELQHLARWMVQPAVDAWVNEGSSELSMRLAGYRVLGSDRAFLAAPDTQLTAWSEDLGRSGPHYGAAYLFMSYFAERFGPKALLELEHTAGRGVDLFDNFLAAAGRRQTFDDLFVDWTVANYLDDPDVAGGRYAYQNLPGPTRSVTLLGPVRTAVDNVSQYAARYYSFPPFATDMQFTFTGTQTVPLLPTDPHSGRYFWWSNRGDVMDSRLTLSADLRGLSTATLRFWTWYEIEQYYDYAYVCVSADGGRSWTILPAQHTTTDNPAGNAFGPGYTGRSGGGAEPQWVQETVDLSRFVGQRVQIRFEYVTDETFSSEGMALDDIEIPELHFSDGAEGPSKFVAEGFVRTDNQVPQRYALRLVREGAQTDVEEIPVDAHQQASVRIPATNAGERLTLVVAAMAPLTTERASMTYSLQPVRGLPSRTPTAY